MAEGKGLDRLTGQLYYLPTIIGKMGLNIAEAQQALNADYVRTITNLLRLMKQNTKEDDATLGTVLGEMAPSRYQFTESTIEFHADLAESLDVGGSVGVGFGMAGFVVNATATTAFARDYRAAARITSVLHAVPSSEKFGESLLKRAKSIAESGVDLPERSTMETMVWDEMESLRELLGRPAADPDGG